MSPFSPPNSNISSSQDHRYEFNVPDSMKYKRRLGDEAYETKYEEAQREEWFHMSHGHESMGRTKQNRNSNRYAKQKSENVRDVASSDYSQKVPLYQKYRPARIETPAQDDEPRLHGVSVTPDYATAPLRHKENRRFNLKLQDDFLTEEEKKLKEFKKRLEMQYPMDPEPHHRKLDSGSRANTDWKPSSDFASMDDMPMDESFSTDALQPLDENALQRRTVLSPHTEHRKKVESRFYSPVATLQRDALGRWRKKRQSPKHSGINKQTKWKLNSPSRRTAIASPIRAPPLSTWVYSPLSKPRLASNNDTTVRNLCEDFLPEDPFAAYTVPSQTRAAKPKVKTSHWFEEETISPLFASEFMMGDALDDMQPTRDTMSNKYSEARRAHEGISPLDILDRAREGVAATKTRYNDRQDSSSHYHNAKSTLSKLSDTLNRFSTKYEGVDNILTSKHMAALSINSSASNNNTRDYFDDDFGAQREKETNTIAARIERTMQELQESMDRMNMPRTSSASSFASHTSRRPPLLHANSTSALSHQWNRSNDIRTSEMISSNPSTVVREPKRPPVLEKSKSAMSIFDSLLSKDFEENRSRLHRFRDTQYA